MDLIPLPAPEVPTKENHFHYLFSIYIFCTFTSLFEPAPALQVVQHITMSLKSLVISFPWPCHYSSPALPLWPFLSLSRCSSNPALLQRLKIKEIKHRYWVLACELPLCKGETSLPALLSIAWHGRPPLVRAFLLQEHFHPLPKHLRFHYCRPFSWIHRHESLRELDWSWQQKLSQWITVTEKGLPASKNLLFWNERELVDGFFTSANALLSSPLQCTVQSVAV